MRSLVVISALLGVGLLGARVPRAADPATCTTAHGIAADTLRTLAREHYPDALADMNRNRFVVVGLLFDTECRVTHHALGHRAAGGISTDSVRAQLFPGVRTRPWVVAGIAEAAERGEGSPWIVWAIVRSEPRSL